MNNVDRDFSPSWMVTYSDALSLLVTFFVMLMAFSDVSNSRFSNAMNSAREQLGGTQKQKEFLTNFKSSIPALDPLIEKILISYAAAPKKLPKDMPFYFVHRSEGLAVVLNGKDLFKEGTAVAYDSYYDEIYASLRSLSSIVSNEIKIVSILPESATVRSENTKTPWGLAAERAALVLAKILDGNDKIVEKMATGIIINSEEKNKEISSNGFPEEQIQVVFCGLNDIEQMLPREIVNQD